MKKAMLIIVMLLYIANVSANYWEFCADVDCNNCSPLQRLICCDNNQCNNCTPPDPPEEPPEEPPIEEIPEMGTIGSILVLGLAGYWIHKKRK